MTDKERLETIKELVKKIESILYDEWRQQELTNLIESLYYDDHVDWLINRVEELAKERAEWEIEARTQYAINKRLKKEIKQYRQALREIRNTDTTKEVYRLWAEQALKGEYGK